jgi:hypothetical protein
MVRLPTMRKCAGVFSMRGGRGSGEALKRAALLTWLEVQRIKRDIERDAQP